MSDSDDKKLEQYLSGDSELSRQYLDESQQSVPTQIDDAILSAAKFKIRSQYKQNDKNNQFFEKWQIPLSIAAVLVISVSLVITLYDEYGQSYLEPMPKKSTPVETPGSMKEESANASHEFDGFADSEESMDNLESSEHGHFSAPKTEAVESLEAAESIPESAKPVARAPAENGLGVEIQQEQQIDKLKQDVEELKKAQSTLLEEREQLKQSIEQIENKKLKIKEKLPSSLDIQEPTETKNSQLQEIKTVWESGSKNQAIKMLKSYLQQNPDFNLETLRGSLPAELLDSVSNPP